MSVLKNGILLAITLALMVTLGYAFVLKKRNFQHDLRRARLLTESVVSGSALYVRACLCRPDRNVTFTRDDGLKVAGSLYGTANPRKSPVILLLHGNTPLGRKLPLYKVLATKLAEKRYLVMTIDLTGFGESGDPFELGTKEALQNDKDVYAALQYLLTQKTLGDRPIYVLGHSAGAEPAMRVGIVDDRIRGIVALGPPRRTTERLQNPNDRNYFWNRARLTRTQLYGEEFPDWYTEQIWIEHRLQNHIGNYRSYFSQNGHKPLLLMDGELESEEDKLFLQNYYAQITEPKEYVTIANSDHYSNTRGVKGVSIYDADVVAKTIAAIDSWIVENTAPGITKPNWTFLKHSVDSLIRSIIVILPEPTKILSAEKNGRPLGRQIT